MSSAPEHAGPFSLAPPIAMLGTVRGLAVLGMNRGLSAWLAERADPSTRLKLSCVTKPCDTFMGDVYVTFCYVRLRLVTKPCETTARRDVR